MLRSLTVKTTMRLPLCVACHTEKTEMERSGAAGEMPPVVAPRAAGGAPPPKHDLQGRGGGWVSVGTPTLPTGLNMTLPAGAPVTLC
jgi:hypothetical protein